MSTASHAPEVRPGSELQVLEVRVRERVLLVRVEDGVAELERTVALNDGAARLWSAYVNEDRAVEDVTRELFEKSSRAAEPMELGVDEVEQVARAVLGSGRRLRFRAHGGSMRPQIPDGSWVEVRPAEFAAVRRGDIAFYVLRGDEQGAAHPPRWVAHRVIARREDHLLARGDSAWRVDRVGAEQFLGVVAARLLNGPDGRERRIPLDASWRRWSGLWRGRLHRCTRAALRLTIARPFRLAFLRGALARLMQLASSACTKLERKLARTRRRVDVAISALLPRAAKDAQRRELYESKSIREFTALDENLVAGFTLLEEVLLARHPLPGPGVLVLGCGPGRECAALARLGFEVTGLDRDERMLERARELTADLAVRYVRGEADAFELASERYDAVVVYSGLYNMLLPRASRVALLACAARHLAPGGVVQITFLSDYVAPGKSRTRRDPWLLRAIEPEHEEGDLFLLNETVHVFPFGEDVADEARQAGLEVVEIFRDQRGYDREARQVRGYAVLRAAQVADAPCR